MCPHTTRNNYGCQQCPAQDLRSPERMILESSSASNLIQVEQQGLGEMIPCTSHRESLSRQ